MTRTVRFAAIFAVTALVTASAQQPGRGRGTGPTYPTPAPGKPVTDVTKGAKPEPGVLGPAPNFTGNTTTLNTEGYSIGRRVFAAGARNSTWHAHSAGQLVFGEAGVGRVQIQGQPIKELKAGDSFFIPAGIFHWHGASPNENFTMVYITMGASTISQGEPVTEQVYLGKKQ